MSTKFLPSITIFTFLILISGCVSKRKYVEMEAGRRRAEQRVVTLTHENKDLQKEIRSKTDEHNKMLNTLLGSNAVKDDHIDSLSKVVVNLNHNVSEKNASIEEQIYAFQSEKRRLRSQIEDQVKEINRLKSEIKSISSEKLKAEDQLILANFQASKEKEAMKKLQFRIQTLENDLIRMQNQLNKTEELREKMSTQLASKEETIERLENNVILLKNQLGK